MTTDRRPRLAPLLLAAAITLALAPAGLAATPAAFQGAYLDVTTDLDPLRLAVSTDCEQRMPWEAPMSTITPLPDVHGFRFAEVDAQQTASGTPGHTVRGCAQATLSIDVPAGADHIHVRFDADREVDIMDGSIQAVTGPRFTQRIELAWGADRQALEYHNSSADDAPVTSIDPAPARPDVARLQAVWTFADGGSRLDNSLITTPQGGAYASTVTNVTIEASGLPVAALASADTSTAGTTVLEELRVAVAVPASTTGARHDVRVRMDPSYSVLHVIAPDGAVLEATATRTEPGPGGIDPGSILVERTDAYLQLTVPAALASAHGTGTYTFVGVRQGDLVAVPALLPLAIAMLLVPFPFAALAWFEARHFEREAFGGFRRSARNLRIAVAVMLGYYLIVAGAAVLGGRIATMARFPLGLDGILLYLQLAVAGAAFVALWLVARELYRITVPPKAAKGNPDG